MIIKAYQESLPLRIMRCLIPRYELSSSEKQQYLYMEKGHDGELKFASMLENLPNNFLILHDLLLEYDHTTFQIDALLITHKIIHLFDVKNFEADFYMDSGNWYTSSGREIKNPLLQLNRCESLFRQLLQKWGYNIPINGKIIFINSEFTLFQAPLNLPIVLPTQLNRFLSQFNDTFPKPNKSLINLAKKLMDSHITESPHQRIPRYNYNQLKKGIVCISCNSISTSLIGRRTVCNECRHEEPVNSSVKRSIDHFRLLFPNKKITTNVIYDWCGMIGSKKMISRILGSCFTRKGNGRRTHYVDSE